MQRTRVLLALGRGKAAASPSLARACTCSSSAALRARAQVQVSSQMRRLSFLCRSLPIQAEHTMDLPGLGDSISEGMIVQWVKKVGDAVAVDDVVALVETDKVSVEIRSTHSGVLVKHCAAVDENLEVGSALCVIDGDGVTAAPPAAAPEPRHSSPTPPPPAEDDAVFAAHASGALYTDTPDPPKPYSPMIKFLGKRANLAKESTFLLMPTLYYFKLLEEPGVIYHTPGALDFTQIEGGALFGRPSLSADEIEAIDSGGADSAPQGTYSDVWSPA